MIKLTFQQRCQQVGLYEGSLFAWLDKVEQLTKENARLRDALEEIKFRSVSLADAQVNALEALTQPETP